MRTKDALLKDVRDDILNERYKDKAPLSVQFHLIEVLLDIRDILAGSLETALTIKRVMDEE